MSDDADDILEPDDQPEPAPAGARSRASRPAPRPRTFRHGRRWFVGIVVLSVLALGASYAFESDPLEVTVSSSPTDIAEFCRRYLVYQENAQLDVDLAKGPAPIEVARDRLQDAAQVAPPEIESDLDALVAGATELADEIRRIADAQLPPGEAAAEVDGVVNRLGNENAVHSQRVATYYARACADQVPTTQLPGASVSTIGDADTSVSTTSTGEPVVPAGTAPGATG